MSTQGLGQFLERDVGRRIVPDLDLNSPPPVDNIALVSISFHASSQGLPVELSRGSQLRNSVEVIDDDIATIDRSTFTGANNNSRSNHSQFGLRNMINEAGESINSLSELTELEELTTQCSKLRRTASVETKDLCMILGAN